MRIVVPYPPGGSSDIIARLVSQPLVERAPPDFARFFDTERKRWARVVAEAGVKLD